MPQVVQFRLQITWEVNTIISILRCGNEALREDGALSGSQLVVAEPGFEVGSLTQNLGYFLLISIVFSYFSYENDFIAFVK